MSGYNNKFLYFLHVYKCPITRLACNTNFKYIRYRYKRIFRSLYKILIITNKNPIQGLIQSLIKDLIKSLIKNL